MSDDAPTPSAFDTPIVRATIDQLPLTTLDNWLTEIRARRLDMVHKLHRVRAAKRAAFVSDVVEKYQRLYQRVANRMDKLDDEIGKVEEQVQKLRAMQLQIDDVDLMPSIEEEAEDAGVSTC